MLRKLQMIATKLTFMKYFAVSLPSCPYCCKLVDLVIGNKHPQVHSLSILLGE